jgi:site-specific recombinase XerD
MFEHFRRHLLAAETTVATFGPDHIDTFWQSPDARGYSTATRMRYLKLLDRLCRHLVAIGVRKSNPVGQLVRNGHWPKAEPDPIYLPEDADACLQAWVQPHAGDDPAALRNRAIVAFFLGTGVTALEGRTARREDLQPDATPPYLHVPAHGARDTRTIHLAAFAVPILTEWCVRRQTLPIVGDLAAGGCYLLGATAMKSASYLGWPAREPVTGSGPPLMLSCKCWCPQVPHTA